MFEAQSTNLSRVGQTIEWHWHKCVCVRWEGNAGRMWRTCDTGEVELHTVKDNKGLIALKPVLSPSLPSLCLSSRGQVGCWYPGLCAGRHTSPQPSPLDPRNHSLAQW